MSRDVYVETGPASYVESISVGPHVIQVDEPVDAGGKDAGPGPYELLLGALGACTCITVRMYAERRHWPLEGVRVRLSYAKAHAEDCVACATEARMIDRVDMEITFVGPLSEEQRLRLTEIANHCPIHRTLTSQVQIVTQSK